MHLLPLYTTLIRLSLILAPIKVCLASVDLGMEKGLTCFDSLAVGTDIPLFPSETYGHFRRSLSDFCHSLFSCILFPFPSWIFRLGKYICRMTKDLNGRMNESLCSKKRVERKSRCLYSLLSPTAQSSSSFNDDGLSSKDFRFKIGSQADQSRLGKSKREERSRFETREPLRLPSRYQQKEASLSL